MRRNDIIDLMLDAMAEDAKNQLDDLSIIATAFIMIVAGYDTTAQTMSYAAYELAKNPAVQEKLRVRMKYILIREKYFYF